MQERGWLLVGTGTGVGTTVVAAALCALRTQLGREVVYVKPVQAGAADGHDDAADVAALTGVATVTGAMLGPALPPGLAARRGGATLRGQDLAAVIADTSSGHPGAELVVEGAGGLLDELGSDGTTAADLAAVAGLPLLVVAPPGIRALSHVALTLEVAAARGLAVAGVVVTADPDHVDADHADGAAADDLAELDRVTGCLVGALPALDLGSPTAFAAAGDHLGPTLGGRWTRPPVA